MESKFFGFFKKSRQTKTNEITNEISLVRHSEDIQVEIRSDTIDISTDEADRILEIICDEVRNPTHKTAFIIAKRIVMEGNSEKICTAKVEGGTTGKNWLVNLSHNPLEFID